MGDFEDLFGDGDLDGADDGGFGLSLPGIPANLAGLLGDDDVMEMLGSLAGVIPAELQMAALMAMMNPAIQPAIAKVKAGGTKVAEGLGEIAEGVQAAVDAVGKDTLMDAARTLPTMLTDLVTMVSTEPQFAVVRQALTASMGDSARPGTSTATLGVIALLASEGGITLKTEALPAEVKAAVDSVIKAAALPGHAAAIDSIVTYLAKQRGVERDDELGRWNLDQSRNDLITGAAKRLVAKRCSKLGTVKQAAVALDITRAIEDQLESFGDVWTAKGTTVASAQRGKEAGDRAVAAITAVLATVAPKTRRGPSAEGRQVA